MAMTRRRYVTPETFGREDLLNLPPAVRLTEIGLRMYADDEGRERLTPALLRANLYPLNPEITDDVLTEHLLALDEAGSIVIYDVGDRTFYAMTDWPTVDRPARSKHPEPPAEPFANDSRAPRDSFVAGERGREGGRGGEGAWERGGGESASRSPREDDPPSPFCRSHPEGTEHPCRGCGTARLRHRQWTDRQMAQARSVSFEGGS